VQSQATHRDSPGWQTRKDKRSHPLGDRRTDLLRRALASKLKGKVLGDAYEVEAGEFVELTLDGTDQVWTVLGEFPDYPHNSIPEPDRAVDNTTIWREDFSRDHYRELLFAENANSVREFFLEQSSGRYTITGDVTEWVMVPKPAATYDDGDPGSGVATNVWLFLQDTLDGWYAAQGGDGSVESINAFLAQYDVWDRYDYDNDGNFDEPDGYIDHFQSLHSGEGNEAGGGELGDDAIWSHSWYAYYTDIGVAGPTLPDGPNLLGGIRIGQSDYWVGDYTIQPENGGVGVFAHEYTHDLGIPDLYDYYGENGTGFWTLMSSGSWLSDSTEDIGSKPNHLGPWEKLALGWLDYAVATGGTVSELTLGPAEHQSTRPQALVVNLPDKEVVTHVGTPYEGEWMYYSGAGDQLDHWMYRAYTLPAGASLTARVFYQIELDWDYAYLVVSQDGGATWSHVPTSRSTDDNPNGNNLGSGITGTTKNWMRLTADLSAYEGAVLLGFRYKTDEAVSEPGFMADEIVVTGSDPDGAEADLDWSFVGFKRSSGTEVGLHHHYYLAEYRQYWGYDAALATVYNFGFLKGADTAPNWVERFPYQTGLLVWYCDDSQGDNNVAQHPGHGFALPVDAHPTPLLRPDGKVWRNRVQAYDATFGIQPTDGLTLHYNSRESVIPALDAVPVFDDALSYWSADNPTGSVLTPTTGSRIEVLDTSTAPDGGSYMAVAVTAPALE
jgi:immune inhibitor A